ncbi:MULTISPECIES: GNAT family N-acetyltransferase [Bacillaceae]|uniref:GNAT family N-acetyltransferase n=1 Tax=Evansella alkalicola TaxID=745819 RepID=A0ABS6JVW5_9BACI|nr:MULTISPECIES: GNAT family N-acetyltransferase [Bacillaceae]MBU9721829.1 GNAT family N-acetyltransferase [Bacillus alkalicola]
MKVFKVCKDSPGDMQQSICNVMLEQMNALTEHVTEEALLKSIQLAFQEDSGTEFFVAEINGNIVGCAFLNSGISLDKGGPYIWLNDLYVLKKYRKQGIARNILLNVLYWAEQEGFNGIELETGVNNIATKKLYNSLGFYDIVSKRYGRQLKNSPY